MHAPFLWRSLWVSNQLASNASRKEEREKVFFILWYADRIFYLKGLPTDQLTKTNYTHRIIQIVYLIAKGITSYGPLYPLICYCWYTEL